MILVDERELKRLRCIEVHALELEEFLAKTSMPQIGKPLVAIITGEDVVHAAVSQRLQNLHMALHVQH